MLWAKRERSDEMSSKRYFLPTDSEDLPANRDTLLPNNVPACGEESIPVFHFIYIFIKTYILSHFRAQFIVWTVVREEELEPQEAEVLLRSHIAFCL